MKRALVGIGSLALLSCALFAQSTAAPVAFEIADVHASHHSTQPFVQRGVLRGDKYIVRQATMVDMIAAAYGVEPEKILGGPSWLESDRFDVTAKAPPKSSPDTLKLMFQALLADRFKLVVHTDNRPVQQFVLTVGKGKPKLKESDGSGATQCQPTQKSQQQDSTQGAVSYIMVSCRNMTTEGIAQFLHQAAGGYLTSPVVDSTGLKGSWDFDIKWTGRGALAQAGADGISIFDAVDKQLGLKLELQKVPVPVLAVDSVNEKPTDNPPGLASFLPPAPPPEFEVAVIKPSPPDATIGGRILPSGQVNLQGFTLKLLITIAWELNPNDNGMIAGAPKWLDSAKFDIIAKPSIDMPDDASAQNNALPIDPDDLRQMLRALIVDRFKMESHMEDRPVNAYTLVAVNPKLKKADPTNRTACKEGPGADGKDPRIANPALARLVSCQNMTMAQFAAQLPTIAGGYIFSPALDATGLEGAWDFTLNFSPAGGLLGGGGGGRGGGSGQPGDGTPSAPEPSGALSLIDAVSKQLGLKLEMHKRPLPVLVIDHIQEKPTDN